MAFPAPLWLDYTSLPSQVWWWSWNPGQLCLMEAPQLPDQMSMVQQVLTPREVPATAETYHTPTPTPPQPHPTPPQAETNS